MTNQLANLTQQTNCSTKAQLPVGWIGECQGGLKWLRCAVERHCNVVALDVAADKYLGDRAHSTLETVQETGLQRLIFSLNNRPHLDSQTICRLQQIAGEIPLAVGCSSWLDGSRRTGMGETGALLLPWNRWWDGWHEWLSKPPERTLRAWTSATAPLTAPEPFDFVAPPSGLVISDCRQTANGWCDSVRASAHETSPADCVSSRRLPTWQGEPKWVLLDDTADLLRVGESNGPAKAASFLRQRFPDATIVIATTICRSDQWLPLQALPNCETIAKPSTGRSLRNLLRHYFG